MDYQATIQQLDQHREVFHQLFSGVSPEVYHWKPQPGKWCLLEILCHLYDEEREDFRTRLKLTLEQPGVAPPMFDQIAWVMERNYIGQDYEAMLEKLLAERQQSVDWLKGLQAPNWDNSHPHPKLGPMSARLYLANWLAHDYLHIRQILKLKFAYLKQDSGVTLDYAGIW